MHRPLNACDNEENLWHFFTCYSQENQEILQ